MVSSQIPSQTKTSLQKSFQRQFLLLLSAPDLVPSEQVELDFSDVFGPLPSQVSSEISNEISESDVFPEDMGDLVYDDPEIVYNRSHSLVGPSSISQSLKIGRLAIHETEDSVELVESVIRETIREDQEFSVNDSDAMKDDDSAKPGAVCLEDFEVMKVVGQDAFGKCIR